MIEKNSLANQTDLRGLACPVPVIETKKILDQKSNNPFSVLVDSEITVKNLERLTKANRAQILESQKIGAHYRVLIAPANKDAVREEVKDASKVGPIVFLSKDSFGMGSNTQDHDFSNHLLNMFLQSLLATGHQIDAILMANSGVKILANQAFREVLDQFEAAGTKVLACGLCVEYYEIKDQVPTEKITNMFAICEYLMTAQRVLEP